MSHRCNYLRAFRLNMLMLKLTGQWCFKTEFFYKLYKHLLSLVLVMNYLSMVGSALLNFQDKEVSKNLYNVPSITTSVVKNVMFRRNFAKVREMFILLKMQHEKARLEDQQIVNREIAFSDVTVKSCFYLVLVMSFTLFLAPLMQEEPTLPLIIWLPFDYRAGSIVFGVVYSLDCLLFLYYSYTNVATDLFFYISSIQIGAQCDIVDNRLKKVTEIETKMSEHGETPDNQMQEILVECVRYYNTILDYTKILTDCYKEILMVQFVCSCISICVTMYQLSLTESVGEASYLCFFMSAAIYEIFLYCFFGNRILEKSGTLFYATFESKWYDASERFKRDLFTFMGHLRNPIVFYVWNIFPLNFETFKKIMQKSWSFFVTLRNTHDLHTR
ncbi:hypothetical protein MTP99_003671 [Tenebrio molitor]|uniref:odorant receptor 4-like isoform X2 n=1 Tax=Tenebrio molitor TaxID=7067 RepID=UPI0026F4EB28|nr:hypothetical protein MTP99_003671 [Tenebrio molitor]